MGWTIDYAATARKQLSKLDRQTAWRIDRFLMERVATLQDPRDLGKQLTGSLGDYWRYRVGDYRIVAEIQDGVFVVLVVRIAHRRQVYR